jgi:hypothetical protein
MIAWLGRWKERNPVLFAGFQVFAIVIGMGWGVYNIGKEAYSQFYNVDRIEWGMTSFPIRNPPEDQKNKALMDKLVKTPGYMTVVSLPNNTRRKLTGVVVQSNHKGYLGYTNPKGDINELEPFDGRADLPNIPPHSALGLTLWHSEEPKVNDIVEVSTEQTGTVSLPFHTKGNDVNRWYIWGFWSCLLLLVIVGFQGLKWRRNQKERGPQLQETKGNSKNSNPGNKGRAGERKKGKKGKEARPANTPT